MIEDGTEPGEGSEAEVRLAVAPEPGPDPGEVTEIDLDGSDAVMVILDVTAADLDELVEAARVGHREAFDELVRRTHADTYTLARRLVSDDEDAQDVVQEAYLRAFRSIRKFRGEARERLPELQAKLGAALAERLPQAQEPEA